MNLVMHRHIKGDCVSQGTAFAILPTRTRDAGWIWLCCFHWVLHEWGWGFGDEIRFASEREADAFYERHCTMLGV